MPHASTRMCWTFARACSTNFWHTLWPFEKLVAPKPAQVEQPELLQATLEDYADVLRKLKRPAEARRVSARAKQVAASAKKGAGKK